jgi:hypothetical protein
VLCSIAGGDGASLAEGDATSVPFVKKVGGSRSSGADESSESGDEEREDVILSRMWISLGSEVAMRRRGKGMDDCGFGQRVREPSKPSSLIP